MWRYGDPILILGFTHCVLFKNSQDEVDECGAAVSVFAISTAVLRVSDLRTQTYVYSNVS
jgi:hypothetical protein